MRLALLSDLHGNPIALDAVLDDIASRGSVDRFVVLGDLVAIGHDPVGVLERPVTLPGACIVQGNTDRYVVTGQRPYPSFEDVAADTTLIPRLVEVAHSFAWTQGMVSASGWLDWLTVLPLEQRFTLPDGTVVLATHVAPGQDDGAGIHSALSDAELAALVGTASAELVCVGHTHRPLDRTVGNIRVVNTGSISNPVPSDPRASYALVEATPLGYSVRHRRVAYDYAAVISAVERSRHPSGDYIISHFRGQRRPGWPDE
jgi:putative phosphoesterase